ncbi:MAG: hypothetical protein CV088_11885 [Nitrospira sp. LK70]|nr:hypothetical protein [Nitrospira sp. LK70]
MEHLDLGTMIVAGLCGIGLIELLMWIIVMIRHPGCDDLRLVLVKASSARPGGDDSSHGSHPAAVQQ